MIKKYKNKTCYGTKEYKESNIICKQCKEYIKCGKIKLKKRRPRLIEYYK